MVNLIVKSVSGITTGRAAWTKAQAPSTKGRMVSTLVYANASSVLPCCEVAVAYQKCKIVRSGVRGIVSLRNDHRFRFSDETFSLRRLGLKEQATLAEADEDDARLLCVAEIGS
jgi:hypothetical protein